MSKYRICTKEREITRVDADSLKFKSGYFELKLKGKIIAIAPLGSLIFIE
jgi:hypothetical protein